jgi:hypothetical protein
LLSSSIKLPVNLIPIISKYFKLNNLLIQITVPLTE